MVFDQIILSIVYKHIFDFTKVFVFAIIIFNSVVAADARYARTLILKLG